MQRRTPPWTFLQTGLQHIGPFCSAVTTMLQRHHLSVATYGPADVVVRTETQSSHEPSQHFRKISVARIVLSRQKASC